MNEEIPPSRLAREVADLVRPFVAILLVCGLLYGFIVSKDISSDAFLTVAGGALGWLYSTSTRRQQTPTTSNGPAISGGEATK